MEEVFNQLLKQMKELTEQLQYQSAQLQQQSIQLQRQTQQLSALQEMLAKLKVATCHELSLHLILNFFYIRRPVQMLAVIRHVIGELAELLFADPVGFFDAGVRS